MNIAVIDEGERLIKAEARKRGIAKSEVSGLFSQSLEDGGRYQSTLGSYGDEVETEARWDFFFLRFFFKFFSKKKFFKRFF